MNIHYAYVPFSFHVVNIVEMSCLCCSRTISDLSCMFIDFVYVVVMLVVGMILLCCRLGRQLNNPKISQEVDVIKGMNNTIK